MTEFADIQRQTAEVHTAIRAMVTRLSRGAATSGRVLPALAVAAVLRTDVGRQACNGLPIGVLRDRP